MSEMGAIRYDAHCQSRLKRDTHFISAQVFCDDGSDSRPVNMVAKESVIALSYSSRSEPPSCSASTRRSKAMERLAVPLSYTAT